MEHGGKEDEGWGGGTEQREMGSRKRTVREERGPRGERRP